MPITPLHFGVLAPVNHFFPGKVSVFSFALVNLWIDTDFIEAALLNQPFPDHGGVHSLVGVLIVGTVVAMPGVRRAKWVIGAYLGALSHLLLDGLIHPEMQPFRWIEGNPLYLGIHQELSLFLLPLTLWFIVQTVSSFGDWVRKRRAADAGTCPKHQ